MAYLRKLPSGKWQATVRDPGGKRHTQTDKLKSVVRAWAAEQEARWRGPYASTPTPAPNAQAAVLAERRISQALTGLQVEALGDGGTFFNPAGHFVYCLWGDDLDEPIYVGKSANILARLGQHATEKRGLIRGVTLLRCETARQMDETETRMIAHYQPELNIVGVKTRGRAS